jgi:hypothetical protein
MTAAASAVPPTVEPVPAAASSSATDVVPVAQDTTAFAPRFDRSKASSGPERLICGTPALAAVDVELAQSYKRQMGLTNDKSQLKAAEIEWRTTGVTPVRPPPVWRRLTEAASTNSTPSAANSSNQTVSVIDLSTSQFCKRPRNCGPYFFWR